MICDYCQRPAETDSQGRCVNCGAQHYVNDACGSVEPTRPDGNRWIAAYNPVSDSYAVVPVACARTASR